MADPAEIIRFKQLAIRGEADQAMGRLSILTTGQQGLQPDGGVAAGIEAGIFPPLPPGAPPQLRLPAGTPRAGTPRAGNPLPYGTPRVRVPRPTRFPIPTATGPTRGVVPLPPLGLNPQQLQQVQTATLC
jgi:hypothetical protein